MAARIAVTETELLAELANAAHGAAPEDARTCRELARAAGISVNRVKSLLHRVADEGRLVPHQVLRTGLDGRPARTSAYTILPATKVSKR